MRALLTILGVTTMGCSAGWIDAARDSVDALNTATTLAWQEYARDAKTMCDPAIARCAETHATLDECHDYQDCLRTIRSTAQTVSALHELVGQARAIFSALRDDPENATYAARAQQIFRLVLKHASTIADALAELGVPMEVPR